MVLAMSYTAIFINKNEWRREVCNLSKLFGKVFDFIDEYLGALVMLLIVVDVILQVLSRILPGNSISWTVEVGEMLLGALIWLCLSDGVRKGAHVSFDLVIRNFPMKTKKIIVIIDNVLFLCYMTLLSTFIIQALEYYQRLGTKSAILQINIFWVRLPMLIGCILTALRLIQEIYLIATNKKEIKLSDSIASEGGV